MLLVYIVSIETGRKAVGTNLIMNDYTLIQILFTWLVGLGV